MTNEDKKIKVQIVASLGPKPYAGGIETVIDTLLNSGLRNGHDFLIYDTFRKPDPNRKTREKLFYSFFLFRDYLSRLAASRPDIVHIHFCSGVDFWKHSICLLAAKILRIKTVFHCHGGSFDTFYANSGPSTRKIIRFVFAMPDIVIALSNYWHGFLSSLTRSDKIRIVPNPVDCDSFATHSVDYAGITEKNVILVGCIGERKGHFDVLRAIPEIVRRHPDVHVLFAGPEEDMGAIERLQSQARETGVSGNIQFLGSVSGTVKLDLFGGSSIVILPSYGENMPISVLEGMSARRAVIASRVGAIPELFGNDEFGLMIDPGDWQGLAGKINYLLDNPEIARKLGEKGFSRVKDTLDVQKIIMLHEEVYEGLLD